MTHRLLWEVMKSDFFWAGVKLGPVQTPNFSRAEPNSNQGRPKLFRPAELIQTPILIPAELNSEDEKCSFRSNCLQNTL